MNMLEAARETIALGRTLGLDNILFESDELNFSHLEEFSEGKMGRWLGWIQASVVHMSVGGTSSLTIEHMKEINRRWS